MHGAPDCMRGIGRYIRELNRSVLIMNDLIDHVSLHLQTLIDSCSFSLLVHFGAALPPLLGNGHFLPAATKVALKMMKFATKIAPLPRCNLDLTTDTMCFGYGPNDLT